MPTGSTSCGSPRDDDEGVAGSQDRATRSRPKKSYSSSNKEADSGLLRPHAEHDGGAAGFAINPAVIAAALSSDAGLVRKPVGETVKNKTGGSKPRHAIKKVS